MQLIDYEVAKEQQVDIIHHSLRRHFGIINACIKGNSLLSPS